MAIPAIVLTEFADGGNLENSGIAAMLTYTDIDNIIAFVKSGTLSPLKSGENYHLLQSGTTITTNFEVDTQIPPLFGYQPYDKQRVRYCPYDGDDSPASPQYVHSQVFDSSKFYELLSHFIQISDGAVEPIICSQSLDVIPNAWFGVPENRGTVTVLWCYTVMSARYMGLLSKAVQNVMPEGFPNYSTLDTGLTPTAINFLACYTAWSVADSTNSQAFLDLFS